MARYTLKAYDNESHMETEIPVFENGIDKYKVRLQAIDSNLLNNPKQVFKDKKDYIKHLNELGYGFSDKTVFYITYQYDGKELKVPTIFGSNIYIEYLSYFYTTCLSVFDNGIINADPKKAKQIKDEKVYKEIVGDKIWQEIRQLFVTNIVTDEHFYRFLKHKIDHSHYKSIEDFVKSTPKNNIFGKDIAIDDDQNAANAIEIRKIKDMLMSYKNLRSIILAREEYAIKNNVEFGIDASMVANELKKLRNVYEAKPYFGPDDHQIKIEDVYTDEEVKDMLPEIQYQEYIHSFEKQKTLESK